MGMAMKNSLNNKLEMKAMVNDPSHEASIKLKNVIKLAKKWNNYQTDFNRIQFLDGFNMMNERDQEKAVEKGSELSKILIGWAAATRLELKELAEE